MGINRTAYCQGDAISHTAWRVGAWQAVAKMESGKSRCHFYARRPCKLCENMNHYLFFLFFFLFFMLDNKQRSKIKKGSWFINVN